MEILDINSYTPMIRQYLEIKKDYTDSIVFFRLGDFYEMFFDDAINASRVLEIALTGKDAGVKERVPMCGIPYHAYQTYAAKLLENGYKVVIVEQIEDPQMATGIVKRGVVKILTPGTVDAEFLHSTANNFIAAISYLNKKKSPGILVLIGSRGSFCSFAGRLFCYFWNFDRIPFQTDPFFFPIDGVVVY